eukprot:15070987-Alexandrium_andersonii.AAC.1
MASATVSTGASQQPRMSSASRRTLGATVSSASSRPLPAQVNPQPRRRPILPPNRVWTDGHAVAERVGHAPGINANNSEKFTHSHQADTEAFRDGLLEVPDLRGPP